MGYEMSFAQFALEVFGGIVGATVVFMAGYFLGVFETNSRRDEAELCPQQKARKRA
jgi:hypothetical protein